MHDDLPVSTRSVDIELGGQEVITIDLDNLDPNPEDVLDLLKEGQCKVWVWTKLAGEYWRRGYLDAAERIARNAVECASHSIISRNHQTNSCLAFQANNTASSLPQIYSLLANLQIAHARKAPKVILQDARTFYFSCTPVANMPSSGQDSMKGVKPKEEYYREAAQLLNAGDRAALESGESSGGTLPFLTRGEKNSYIS